MSDIVFKSDVDVSLVTHCGGDDLVAGAAWVSTSGQAASERASRDPEAVAGLIKYLMRHRHGSPFEHGAMTFFVRAPIFVWREWHRHRVGWSYNEESARYKTLDPMFFLPHRDRPMMKIDDWKPGRPKFNLCGNSASYKVLVDNLVTVYRDAYAAYLSNLELGVDPGLARDCLPVGIYSSCWVTCNPRSLMHFLSLRTHEPAARFVSYPLAEIDQAARKLEEAFSRLWPLTHAAFVAEGRVGP